MSSTVHNKELSGNTKTILPRWSRRNDGHPPRRGCFQSAIRKRNILCNPNCPTAKAIKCLHVSAKFTRSILGRRTVGESTVNYRSRQFFFCFFNFFFPRTLWHNLALRDKKKVWFSGMLTEAAPCESTRLWQHFATSCHTSYVEKIAPDNEWRYLTETISLTWRSTT